MNDSLNSSLDPLPPARWGVRELLQRKERLEAAAREVSDVPAPGHKVCRICGQYDIYESIVGYHIYSELYSYYNL